MAAFPRPRVQPRHFGENHQEAKVTLDPHATQPVEEQAKAIRTSRMRRTIIN